MIVPNFNFIKDWSKRKKLNIENLSNDELSKNELVIKRIELAVEKLNANYGHWEQIKKVSLLPKEFTIDGGELTPTLKLKRKIIMEKYKTVVEHIYHEDSVKE